MFYMDVSAERHSAGSVIEAWTLELPKRPSKPLCPPNNSNKTKKKNGTNSPRAGDTHADHWYVLSVISFQVKEYNRSEISHYYEPVL